MSAAFVDDARVREGIGNLLVKTGTLAGESGRRLPSREQMAKYLGELTAMLGEDFRGLAPEDCALQPGKTSTLTVACSQFIGCEGGCQERHAHLTITISSAGARLASHAIGHGDAGRCGCCMHDF